MLTQKNSLLIRDFRGIRGLGSAACNICAVASGQTDAYFETGMHIWDICAAGLILTEAGGVITSTDGKFYRNPLFKISPRLKIELFEPENYRIMYC